MATSAQVPVEVYLISDYEPDAEYVDGHIEERPMGQFNHASWQQGFSYAFSNTIGSGTSVCDLSSVFRQRSIPAQLAGQGTRII